MYKQESLTCWQLASLSLSTKVDCQEYGKGEVGDRELGEVTPNTSWARSQLIFNIQRSAPYQQWPSQGLLGHSLDRSDEEWTGGNSRCPSLPIPQKSKCQLLNCVLLFATPWTVAHQAPLFMGFSRQEYWNGLPFPCPGDLPDPGIKPGSPTFQADSLPPEPPGKQLAPS